MFDQSLKVCEVITSGLDHVSLPHGMNRCGCPVPRQRTAGDNGWVEETSFASNPYSWNQEDPPGLSKHVEGLIQPTLL